jgi:hypothetical protein
MIIGAHTFGGIDVDAMNCRASRLESLPRRTRHADVEMPFHAR